MTEAPQKLNMDQPPSYDNRGYTTQPQGIYSDQYGAPAPGVAAPPPPSYQAQSQAYPKQPGGVPAYPIAPAGGFVQPVGCTARVSESQYNSGVAFVCGVLCILIGLTGVIMQIIQYTEDVGTPGAANAGFWAGINLGICGIIVTISKFQPTVKMVNAAFWSTIVNTVISGVGFAVPLAIYFGTKDDYWNDWWWFPAVAIHLENAKEYTNLTISGLFGFGMIIAFIAHLNTARGLNRWCFKGPASNASTTAGRTVSTIQA